MKLGSTDISKVYLGSTEVSKAYLGSVQVHGSSLPYDAEVEYLQSSGTQYIITAINGQKNQEVKMLINLSSFNGFGANYGLNLTSATLSMNTLQEIDLIDNGSNRITIINGATAQTRSATSQSHPFNIFNLGGATPVSSFMSAGKIYWLKIWNNGSLVRDFIPVRVEHTGYLYDKVSETLFGNAGTGSFTLGSDVTT